MAATTAAGDAKCDEVGPPCTNCILRRLSDCTYSRVLPASLLANGRRTSTSTSHDANAQWQLNRVGSPARPPPTPPKLHSVDELELMHQFTAETYQSLCVSESETRTWQVVVPRLALKHRYLMHGILSLASLHIATTRESSDDALAYIDAGLEYHSRSLEPFRITIGNLTPENCDAAFAQSVATTAISLALPQLTATRENALRMMDNILTVFELLQGVKKILTIGQRQSWINLGLFRQGEFWKKDSIAQIDEDTEAALDQLAALNAQDGTAVNVDVLNHLRHCFMKFSRSSGPAPVLSWLAAVDKEYVESLRRRQPFSMLVLAHWAILLTQLDGRRWWAKKSGRALVSELVTELVARDPLWESCLGWVRRKVADVPRISVQPVPEIGVIASLLNSS
ncbi:Zn(II)2Cys6 transcription factor domain-containing protein [Aspergillus undulatus]|uniref:Zn(II)2Cys6 transcription factor domain-containing protein n=1 Tax=Aspergillus undulatus TaxID=1810928 RepID=UPI003CCE3EFC